MRTFLKRSKKTERGSAEIPRSGSPARSSAVCALSLDQRPEKLLGEKKRTVHLARACVFASVQRAGVRVWKGAPLLQ